MIYITNIDYERPSNSMPGHRNHCRIVLSGAEDFQGQFNAVPFDFASMVPVPISAVIDLFHVRSAKLEPKIFHKEAVTAYGFLAGLQLGDQPARVQREYLAVMAMLGKGLGNAR